MGLLPLREKLSWTHETKICSWLKLPPAPSDLVQGGSDPSKQCPGHQGRAPEHCFTSGHLKTPSGWEKAQIPQRRGWCRAMVSAPSGQQNQGSSSSILGLPRGFMAQLSLLPHFWHPDLSSWVVLLHLELCFPALEFGGYCLQFPFFGCFKSSSEPEGGANPSLGCFCEPRNACETKEGATWNRNCGGSDRDKSCTHTEL